MYLFCINVKKLTLRTSRRLFIKLGYHIMQKDRYLKNYGRAAFLTKSQILLFIPFEIGLIEKKEYLQKSSYLRTRKKLKCTNILRDLFWRHLISWFFQHTSWVHLISHESFHYYKYMSIYIYKSPLQYKPTWTWITNCLIFHSGWNQKTTD